jgi:alpha-mannosidase
VTDDYVARLAAGAAEAEQLVNQVLGGLLSATTPEDAASHTTTTRSAATATARRLLGDDGTTGIADGSAAADSEPATRGVTRLLQCPLLNVSVCDATDRPPPADERTALLVMAYNPLAWQRRDVVRVPVRSAFQVRSITVRTSSDVGLVWLKHTTRHLP